MKELELIQNKKKWLKRNVLDDSKKGNKMYGGRFSLNISQIFDIKRSITPYIVTFKEFRSHLYKQSPAPITVL